MIGSARPATHRERFGRTDAIAIRGAPAPAHDGCSASGSDGAPCSRATARVPADGSAETTSCHTGRRPASRFPAISVSAIAPSSASPGRRASAGRVFIRRRLYRGILDETMLSTAVARPVRPLGVLELVRVRHWGHFLLLPAAGATLDHPSLHGALALARGVAVAALLLSFGYLANAIGDRTMD